MHLTCFTHTYMFVESPGEGSHESPPGGSWGQAHKKTAQASLPDGGSQGEGDAGERLRLELHPGLDDICRLGGGGGKHPCY